MPARPALKLVVPLESEEMASLAESSGEPNCLDLSATFRRYAPYVAAVAHRLLGRDEEVDDTVQEVFLAATRGLASVRDPAAVKGWLARVTVRIAHRRLRSRRLFRFLGFDQLGREWTIVDSSASPEHKAFVAAVYDALDQLPAAQRIAWLLRHVEGERLEDVASMTGCSLATAKRRIAAADVQLQEALR